MDVNRNKHTFFTEKRNDVNTNIDTICIHMENYMMNLALVHKRDKIQFNHNGEKIFFQRALKK